MLQYKEGQDKYVSIFFPKCGITLQNVKSINIELVSNRIQMLTQLDMIKIDSLYRFTFIGIRRDRRTLRLAGVRRATLMHPFRDAHQIYITNEIN